MTLPDLFLLDTDILSSIIISRLYALRIMSTSGRAILDSPTPTHLHVEITHSIIHLTLFGKPPVRTRHHSASGRPGQSNGNYQKFTRVRGTGYLRTIHFLFIRPLAWITCTYIPLHSHPGFRELLYSRGAMPFIRFCIAIARKAIPGRASHWVPGGGWEVHRGSELAWCQLVSAGGESEFLEPNRLALRVADLYIP